MASSYVYIWSYRVRSDREADFVTLYGPDGDWAEFFRQSPDYVGTELLQSPDGWYATIDRWTSREAHAEFVASRRAEFDALDARGELLTEEEVSVGTYETV
jgi:hypothetical protein